MKTGGGSNPIKEDPLCLQVKGILGSAIEPIDNAYDDDTLEGNFEKELEDVVLDVEESRRIPEENVGLQGNEDSVQFTIEDVLRPNVYLQEDRRGAGPLQQDGLYYATPQLLLSQEAHDKL